MTKKKPNEIVLEKVDSIRAYDENAKKHPDDQVKKIAKSIDAFGFNQPIAVDKDGYILAGHGRLQAAILLGMEKVPVLHTDLDGQEAKAYRLADNKLNESEWDMSLVKDELRDLTEELRDLTGFERDILVTDEDKDEEMPDIPDDRDVKSKKGQLYQLGDHRLLCGDSTKVEDVEKLMDGKKADMVFTDPPYGMKLNADYSKMKGWHTGKKYDNVIGDHSDFNNDFINNIFTIFSEVKEKFLFGADYYVDLLPNYGKDGNWFVWDKRVDESKDKMFGSGFEMLWSQQKHQRRLLRGMWAGFMGDAEASKRMHPTQKPTKILVEIMQEYSADKDIIADIFLGSGSTLIAAEKTGRICYGMELAPKYVDVIIKRWEDHTGKVAELIEE